MTLWKTMYTLAAISFASVSCKVPSTPESESPAAQQADDSTPSARKLPVAEDFQAETAATIVQANYRTELDALETELHAEAK
jgi:hypothetical protein